MVQTQRQRSDDARRAALIQQLTVYLQRLQNLLYTIQFGDTDKIDFKKEDVDRFLRDLNDIGREINGLRPIQNLLQAIPWVDGLLRSIESARNELRVINVLLTQSQIERNIRARLKSYENCQDCLTEAIDQLSRLINPLTKRTSRGI